MAHHHTVNVKTISEQGLKREYSVTVPANEVDSEINDQLAKYSKEFKAAGFRPGKAPIQLVKKRFGKEVLVEVLEHLVAASSSIAFKEQGVQPALRPKISIEDFAEGKDLKYKMEFEVLPKAPEVDFAKINLKKQIAEFTDADINKALEEIVKESKDFEKVEDRAAQLNDQVVIDFKGFVADVAFDGGEGKGYNLELGSNSFIPGFEDQLVGQKTGENRRIKVKFPDAYHSTNLAGKDAEFDVTINEIRAPKAAQANDDFAKNMGFESLDKFKEAIKQQMEGEAGGVTRVLFKKTLFDYLWANYKYDVPEQMVTQEFETIWAQMEQMKKNSPESEEFKKPEEELKAEYQDMAKRRVVLGLIISDVGEKEKVQITKEELNRSLYNEASKFRGQEQKVLEFYQKNPQYIEALKGPILEEKVVDLIQTKIKISEEKVTLDQLQKLANEVN
jgi:trigger factor